MKVTKQINFIMSTSDYDKFKNLAKKDYRKPTEMAKMLVLKFINGEIKL